MPQPPEFAEVIALAEKWIALAAPIEALLDATPPDYVPSGPQAIALAASQAMVSTLKGCAEELRKLRTPPTPAGYDAGDVATASAEGFRAGVASVREWLPIESAPRDRLILIVGGTFSSDNYQDMPQHCATIAYWYQDHWRGDDMPSHDDWKRHEPTHWQPLPAPPAIAQPSEVGGAL